jgi:anhydro-N-acetylmuramic acid kinase
LKGVIAAIGLMSGATIEGIDVALLATDGERQLTRGHSLIFPYSPEQRARLREAVAAAGRVWGGGGGTPGDRGLLAEIEQELTRLHAEAVKGFLETYALTRGAMSLISFHGETVYHDAARRVSSELGDGELLAS